MTGTAQQTRRQEQVAQLCAVAVRAHTGLPDLQFRDGVLHDGSTRAHATAPHLRVDHAREDLATARGAADGLALRLLHSDPEEHARRRPGDQVGAVVFELLEQFRVESLADRSQPGTTANLRHRHETWSAQFHASGLTETGTGLLLYAVAQAARAKVTGEPVVEATEDLLEATRFGLAPLVGSDLALLRRLRHDQTEYAAPAHRIAEAVSRLVDAETATGSAPAPRGRPQPRFSLALDEPPGAGDDDPAGAAGTGRTDHQTPATPYRVYTEAYDRELPMTRLARAGQLRGLRERLDDLVEKSGVHAGRLARLLRTLLTAEQAGAWDTAQEEGLVDSGRLSRLVTSPTDARVFRTPRDQPRSHLQVTLLLDCSGSMRRHQERTAVLVDTLVRALDLAGIDSEVLGFTTGAWNGGRAERDWRRGGRPARPGRLNERLHLVLKDPDRSWRRARPDIAGLLRGDYYREALDGEAVGWAAARLQGRPDLDRRLLVVLTDGSPMDSATNLVNDPGYLDRHLLDELARLQAEGAVRVLGIGVGLDLSRYYRYAHVLDFESPVDQSTLREVVALLAASVTRSP